MEQSKNDTRRTFLKTGLGLGIGVVAYIHVTREGDEKVVLISKEGKLYEVPKDILINKSSRLSWTPETKDKWIKSSDDGGQEQNKA
jgi:hypothetical protein